MSGLKGWVARPTKLAEWEVIIPTSRADDPYFVALVYDCVDGERSEDVARLIASAPALLEALKGLLGQECPIRVKDPFGAAVVDHWTEQKAQGHGYAHLYLNALAAISSATGGE